MRTRVAVSVVLALCLALGAARLGGVLTSPPPPDPISSDPSTPLDVTEKAQEAAGEFQDMSAQVPVRSLLVELSDEQDLGKLRKAMTNEDGRMTKVLEGNWVALELDQKQSAEELQSILQDQGIEVLSAEPQQVRVPTTTTTPPAQWALNTASDRDINAPEAWAVTRGREDVVVAVVDSGVDASHPDLAGAILPGATFNGTRASATANVTAHGTAVAGTVAARGKARIYGAAPQVKILPIKVFGNEDGSGYFSMANYIAGIDWAVANGADIINLSLGCPESQPACYSQAEHDALARADAAGVLVVASAGNKRRNNDVTPDFPSGYDLPNLISVAAVDREFELAGFSQWGPQTVDVAAPGVDIVTTTPDNSTAPWSGTSFAAPLVSGTAALVLSANPSLTPTQVRERIMSTSRQTPALALRVGSGGVVDAHGALLGKRLPIAPAAAPGGPTSVAQPKIRVLSVTAPKSKRRKLQVKARASSVTSTTVLVCTVRNKGKVIGRTRYKLKRSSKPASVFAVSVPVKKLPTKRSKLTVTFTQTPGQDVVGRATQRLR